MKKWIIRRGAGGSGGAPNLMLWLDAMLGKTGNPVSQWNDQGRLSNNAIQSTLGNRPADNSTYLTFDGGDFMTIADNSTLDSASDLTLYSRFSTISATNFMGLIDKYISGDSGYALFLNAAKRATTTIVLSKNEPSVVGTTILNDGVVRGVHSTIECTRKFTGKRFICDGEEPSVIKEGSIYYMFYSDWDGSQFNIYVRSDTSPYFENSSPTLLLSNLHYCSILTDGSTYRLTVTDIVNQNIILYTSSSTD